MAESRPPERKAPSGTSETRRARTFGRDDRPALAPPGAADEAPAWIWGDGVGGGDLGAAGQRTVDGWRVLFSRPRELAGRRQAFRPGETVAFGVAVFDGTATDHHIVRDTRELRLLDEREEEGGGGEGEAPSRLGRFPGQVWPPRCRH